MTGYVYNVDTREIAYEIHGDTDVAIEAKFGDLNMDLDSYGITYSPAFGFADGLIRTEQTEELTA